MKLRKCLGRIIADKKLKVSESEWTKRYTLHFLSKVRKSEWGKALENVWQNVQLEKEGEQREEWRRKAVGKFDESEFSPKRE